MLKRFLNNQSKVFSIAIINFYQQFLSFDKGLLAILAPGGSCRYTPSCSEYTKQMIVKFGVWRGFALGVKRIISCR